MSTNTASVAALIVLSSASMQSYAGCSPTLTTQFESTQRIVDSVRPDKPGQTRVFLPTAPYLPVPTRFG